MQFDGFDWDRGNWEKCQKHGTSIVEIESLFSQAVHLAPDPAHSGKEQRFKAIGRSTTGRWIFLAFTWRRREARLLIRPISARYMHDGRSGSMKPFPPLQSDEEAEAFVADADLTEYDLSNMVTMRFEQSTRSSTVVVPDDLLAASLEKAAHLEISLDTFVRSALERALTVD